MPLLQGDYFLTIFLACENGLQVYEFVERAVTLRVSQTGLEQGLVVMPQQWQDDIMAPEAVGVGA